MLFPMKRRIVRLKIRSELAGSGGFSGAEASRESAFFVCQTFLKGKRYMIIFTLPLEGAIVNE